MTLPVKDLNCVRDGRQLFVPNGRNPSRYISKAGAGLTCCSQNSDEIPLGHDSDIAHLAGCVLPQGSIYLRVLALTDAVKPVRAAPVLACLFDTRRARAILLACLP